MKELERHIRKMGLVPVDDAETSLKSYRLDTPMPVEPMAEIDNKLSDFLNMQRERANITREEMGVLLGLSPQAYGLYERRQSKIVFSRLIQIIELLGIDMLGVLAHAAPQLFGKDEHEARARADLLSIVMSLPAQNMYEIAKYARMLSNMIETEQFKVEREAVRELTQLLEKNGMTNADVKELIDAKNAKRGKYKSRRKAAADDGSNGAK